MPKEESTQLASLVEFFKQHFQHHFNWSLTTTVILLGFIFVLCASLVEVHSIWHDVLRDVGLSLLIAAVVGATYEAFARSHFIRDTMAEMLSGIMGDIVRDDVWNEVKDQIIKKEMIREDMHIFLRIPSGLDPLCNPTPLWLKFNYKLKGLHSRPRKRTVELMHYLDNHIVGENLPRFESIRVGDQQYPTENLAEGIFKMPIELNHRTGDAIPVVIERYELTYIPGSYNLTMTEMTKGFELFLKDIPEDIETIVNIRPHVEKICLTKDDDLHFHDLLLLPGQGIEFRFVQKRDLRSSLSHAK